MTARQYVQRLELAAPCSGRSRASHCAVDLTGVLADARSLEELVADLFEPFERLGGVDLVMAVHDEEPRRTGASNSATSLRTTLSVAGSGSSAPDGQVASDTSGPGLHRFTAAIAGAMAGSQRCCECYAFMDNRWQVGLTFRHHAAYGELSVLRKEGVPVKRSRKRTRSEPGMVVSETATISAGCERIVSVDIAELGMCVELKRRTITPGKRVLFGTTKAV